MKSSPQSNMQSSLVGCSVQLRRRTVCSSSNTQLHAANATRTVSALGMIHCFSVDEILWLALLLASVRRTIRHAARFCQLVHDLMRRW